MDPGVHRVVVATARVPCPTTCVVAGSVAADP